MSNAHSQAQHNRPAGEYGIEVLPERVLKKPVPWLERGEDVHVGFLDEPVTVEHTLFVKGIS